MHPYQITIAAKKRAITSLRTLVPLLIAFCMAVPVQFAHACICPFDQTRAAQNQTDQSHSNEIECCCSLEKVIARPGCCETDASCCKSPNSEAPNDEDCRCEQCPSKRPIEPRSVEIEELRLADLIISIPDAQPPATQLLLPELLEANQSYAFWHPYDWSVSSPSTESLLCVWRL